MTIRFATLLLLSISACSTPRAAEPASPVSPPRLAQTSGAVAAPAPTEALPFGVRVTGHGPAMILIPGLASSGDVWKSTVEHEQARFTCHVIDLPGFAGRPAIPAPILSTVRDALAGYIRSHGLDHPVIVGHSLGGFLALDLARSYPDLVGKLVIVDGAPFLPAMMYPAATPETGRAFAESLRDKLLAATDQAFEQQERGIVASMVTDPANQELVLGWALRSDRAAMTQAMIEVMSTDLRPQLGAIKVPTMVIETWTGWGAGREATERSYAQQYAELRGVKHVIAETAKHFVMLDDPAFLFARMDEFLR